MSRANQQSLQSRGPIPAFSAGVPVERISRDTPCIFRILPEIEKGVAIPFRDADGYLTAWYRIDKMIHFWGQRGSSIILAATVEPSDVVELGVAIPDLYPYNVIWNFLRKNTRRSNPKDPGSCIRPDLAVWTTSVSKEEGAPITYPRDIMTFWAVVYQNLGKTYPNGIICLVKVHAASSIQRMFDKINFKAETGGFVFDGDLVSLKNSPLCCLTKLGAYPMRYTDASKMYNYYEMRVPPPEEGEAGYSYDFYITKETTIEFPLDIIVGNTRPLNYEANGTHRKQTVEEQFALLKTIFPASVIKEAFYDYPYLPASLAEMFMSHAVNVPSYLLPVQPVGAKLSQEEFQRMQQTAQGGAGAANFTAPPAPGSVPQGDALLNTLPGGMRPDQMPMQGQPMAPVNPGGFTGVPHAPAPNMNCAAAPPQTPTQAPALGQGYVGPLPDTHPRMSEIMTQAGPQMSGVYPQAPATQVMPGGMPTGPAGFPMPGTATVAGNPMPGIARVQDQEAVDSFRQKFKNISGGGQ